VEPIYTASDLETTVGWHRGGEILSGPEDQEWGVRMFAVADPDRFKVTVSTPMAAN
jgi:hypothetical protein